MRALVFSAGGVRGAYQVGVVKCLLIDRKRKYDVLCGNSIGAINALFLSQYKLGNDKHAATDLIHVWNNLKEKDIYKNWFPFGKLSFWKSAVDSSPLRRFLTKYVDPENIKTSGRTLRICAVDWETMETRVFTETYHDLIEATMASVAMPCIFPPIKLDGKWYVDGGIRDRLPIKEAVRAGATEIDTIDAYGPVKSDSGKPGGYLSMLPKVIDTMGSEIGRGDLRDMRSCSGRLYKPKDLNVKHSLDFDEELIKALLLQGYNDTASSINETILTYI